MESKPFSVGDEVISISDCGDLSSGMVGKIVGRFRGTVYGVKLPDGSFGWLDSSGFIPVDTRQSSMQEGDIGVVSSDRYHRSLAKVGDKLPVVKVITDMDYYVVSFNNDVKWAAGIQLAKVM